MRFRARVPSASEVSEELWKPFRIPSRRGTWFRVLAALSDENRYRIVELLSNNAKELSCGAIGMALGLSPSLISHHLGVLQSASLIERRKDGLWTSTAFGAMSWAATFRVSSACSGRQ